MHVQLKLILDCDPDAAWRAIKSPTVLTELYGPLLQPESQEGTFPTIWGPGSHAVTLKALGLVPVGGQDIRLDFQEKRPDGVRIMHDSGAPLSGPLTLLTRWDHRMAIAPAPGDPTKTLYRDRLEISGAVAPALWYPLWSFDPERQNEDDTDANTGDAASDAPAGGDTRFDGDDSKL
jgi:hypothetical protein